MFFDYLRKIEFQCFHFCFFCPLDAKANDLLQIFNKKKLPDHQKILNVRQINYSVVEVLVLGFFLTQRTRALAVLARFPASGTISPLIFFPSKTVPGFTQLPS